MLLSRLIMNCWLMPQIFTSSHRWVKFLVQYVFTIKNLQNFPDFPAASACQIKSVTLIKTNVSVLTLSCAVVWWNYQMLLKQLFENASENKNLSGDFEWKIKIKNKTTWQNCVRGMQGRPGFYSWEGKMILRLLISTGSKTVNDEKPNKLIYLEPFRKDRRLYVWFF